MIRQLRIGGGLAAGLALLLAGCSSAASLGPNTSGPFGASPKTSPGSQCFWAPRNEVGTFAALVFAYILVPETKGLSLEAVQALWAKRAGTKPPHTILHPAVTR